MKPASHPHDHSPMPLPQKAVPIFPRAENASEIVFAGFVFAAGDPPQSGGLIVLTRRIGDLLFPVLIGEAEDMVAALEQTRRDEKILAAGLADGVFWMARDNARQRHHILRDLVGKYDPPLNVEFRKGRAAPEIAALVPDRASDSVKGESEQGAEPIEVSEAELRDLVRAFYAEALKDQLIGPVFARSVADWDQHYEIVQKFWSRAMLGTTCYTGSPFTPHLSLHLKPEFFDRWVALFKTMAESHLKPAAARAAISRVEHMSVCFQAGLFPPEIPAKTPSVGDVA